MKYMKDPTKDETFRKRYFKVLDEFDAYWIDHLEIFDNFPYPITIAVTLDRDRDFSSKSISLARMSEKFPDSHPIVTARKVGGNWVLEKLEPQAV